MSKTLFLGRVENEIERAYEIEAYITDHPYLDDHIYSKSDWCRENGEQNQQYCDDTDISTQNTKPPAIMTGLNK